MLGLEIMMDAASQRYHTWLRIASEATQCAGGHCHVAPANSHFVENEASLYEFVFEVSQ